MTGAAGVMMSSHLRVLHAIICALNRPADPLLLFNECEQNLLKDYIMGVCTKIIATEH